MYKNFMLTRLLRLETSILKSTVRQTGVCPLLLSDKLFSQYIEATIDNRC